MKNKNQSAYNILNHWYNSKSLIILECGLLGVFVGFVVVLYRYSIEFISIFIDKYIFSHITNPYYIPIIVSFLLLSAFLVKKMLKYEPLISGSGIPQVKGYIFRLIKMPWKNILVFKFLGGLLSIGSGLSIGREGPSIQLGAAIGKGFCDIFKRKKIEEKYLITGGASAGLAAAFNAPLAGVIFALEEIHKNFSPFIVITVLTTTISAEFVSESFFGVNPVLNFNIVKSLPFKYYYSIIILGIILGFAGILYNYLLIKSLDFFKSNVIIKSEYKIYFVFLISGLVVAFYPEIIRGGHNLIKPIVELKFTMKFILLMLFFKLLFSVFSYGSGVPGGIFLPILVIGSMIGSIYGQLISGNLNMESIYIQNMVIFSMAGFLTSVVRAPITSSILICEMTGSFTHFLPVTIVVIISYLIPEFFKCAPIYDTLLKRSLQNNENKYECDENCKILLEKTISLNSELDNSYISTIKWPEKCLIVNVNRGNENYIPKGDMILRASDILTFITDEVYASNVKKELGYLADYSSVKNVN